MSENELFSTVQFASKIALTVFKKTSTLDAVQGLGKSWKTTGDVQYKPLTGRLVRSSRGSVVKAVNFNPV